MTLENRLVMGTLVLCLVVGPTAYPLSLIPSPELLDNAALDAAIAAYPRRPARTAWASATPEERAAALESRP